MSSPPPNRPPPTSLPSWHFPFGPSSRYHLREKSVPHHTRTTSAYTPIAPVLSTERRAHRRRHTQKSSISSLPSPPGSDLSRSPLSRFASYSNSNPGDRTSHMAQPFTPAKTHRRGSSSLQNSSPFSDYYTESARSVDSTVPQETKQLLVRMNKLQSQLMRDNQEPEQNREAMRVVGRKLSEIELELQALHSQARLPIEVEDPGVFMEENESGVKSNRHSLHDPYLSDEHVGFQPEPVTIEQFRAERDWFILRMQELLGGLDTAQEELGKRFAEVRDLNERHNAQIEERETELEQLRSENECLKADLGFEYSELLFLKLQMKSMEVDVDAMDDDFEFPETAASRDKRAKKNRILSEMDRWRADWQDVHSRFKRRRSKYGVHPDRRDSGSEESCSPNGDEVEWHLETVKEGRGRVTSLTIKRMDSTSDSTLIEAAPEDRLGDSTLGESLYGTAKSSTPLEASINLSVQGTADNDNTSATGSHSPGTPHHDDDEEEAKTLLSNHKDLDGHIKTQGPSELQIAKLKSPSPPLYKEHGTQTEEEYSPPKPQDEQKEEEEEDDQRLFTDEEISFNQDEREEEEEEVSSDEDCAITTSSEESDDDGQDALDVEEEEDVDVGEEITTVRPKTAWAELWDSLAALSGMGDDRFEE